MRAASFVFTLSWPHTRSATLRFRKRSRVRASEGRAGAGSGSGAGATDRARGLAFAQSRCGRADDRRIGALMRHELELPLGKGSQHFHGAFGTKPRIAE